MKIHDLKDFFEQQKETAHNKSDKKVYLSLANIISDLKSKNLTEQQWNLIEHEIETLRLIEVAGKNNIGLKKKRNLLIRFLKNNFSFIPKKYYTSLGISMGYIYGAAIGMVLGIVINISSGMIYGMIIGAMISMVARIILGKREDDKAEKENRIIKA